MGLVLWFIPLVCRWTRSFFALVVDCFPCYRFASSNFSPFCSVRFRIKDLYVLLPIFPIRATSLWQFYYVYSVLFLILKVISFIHFLWWVILFIFTQHFQKWNVILFLNMCQAYFSTWLQIARSLGFTEFEIFAYFKNDFIFIHFAFKYIQVFKFKMLNYYLLTFAFLDKYFLGDLQSVVFKNVLQNNLFFR